MEPKFEHTFKYKGWQCAIIKFDWDGDHFPQGYYCGYVQVPFWHEDFERDYNSFPVQCHGGLTYSSHTLLGQVYPGWWIGFDCAHAEDIDNPKDLSFCINQCIFIIDQLLRLGD